MLNNTTSIPGNLSNQVKSDKIGLICTLFITGLIVFIFNKEIIYAPNSHLLGYSGDAIKSYFSTLSMINNDNSFHQLGLMNYPYGQTHIYTDGQTGVAWIIRALGNISPWFTYNAIGIINFFYLISWIFCSLFVYLILQRLSLPRLFTIAGAITITLLSPQIFRVSGHPTLCYVMFFPLAWWLLLKFRETNYKLLYGTIILLNCLFWNFVHPYYLPAITFFYLLVYIIGYLQKKVSKQELLFWGLPLTVLPNLISLLYLHFVDHHSGRSAFPYGFWSYHATIFSVFAPSQAPFVNGFKFIFNDLKGQIWEGWAYIGLSCVLICLYSIFKIFRYAYNRNLHSITHPVYPNELSMAIWPAIILLAYSMCFPFKYGFSFLYDWVGPLRQFRALGRFAWIFYYVFTVFAVYTFYLLWRYLRIKRHKILSSILYFLFFTILFAEGIGDHKSVQANTLKTPNYFNLTSLPDEQRDIIDNINKIKKNYQALICIPFYHVGSENFSKEFTDHSITSSMIVSYWTKMPLLNSSAARSPIQEARNIMQLLGPSFIKKDIMKDLPNKNKFLILLTADPINNQEEEFLSRCKPLFATASFQVFEISYYDLFEKEINYADSIVNKIPTVKYPEIIAEGDTTDLVYQNYNSDKSRQIYEGVGAFQGIKKNYNALITELPLSGKKESTYIASFWYYNKDELRLQNNCIVEEKDQTGENTNWIKQSPVSESLVIDGNWSLVEIEFTITRDNPKITILLNGDSKSEQEIYVDNFLLRKKGTHTFRLEQGSKASPLKKISYDNLPLH